MYQILKMKVNWRKSLGKLLVSPIHNQETKRVLKCKILIGEKRLLKNYIRKTRFIFPTFKTPLDNIITQD